MEFFHENRIAVLAAICYDGKKRYLRKVLWKNFQKLDSYFIGLQQDAFVCFFAFLALKSATFLYNTISEGY